ncbi:olfactory receptor 6C4-like [Mixophyes fleayi]|uniref:olfactory receptor 6C4-like n=1 Tax=Mixophyes fleayi TaxID=3061075 RepID=UPI003F4DC1EF
MPLCFPNEPHLSNPIKDAIARDVFLQQVQDNLKGLLPYAAIRLHKPYLQGETSMPLVGDLVMVKVFSKAVPWDANWEGLYQVLETMGNTILKVQRPVTTKKNSQRRRKVLPSEVGYLFGSKMVETNKTVVEEFVLLAFADLHQFQNLLFFVFLLTYITCVMGNVTIIVLVRIEPSLHTTMYFFISVFSVLEIIFVSVTVPRLLANLITADKIIYFNGCFTQMYVFLSLGATECFLLLVMVFDRHLAINHPLHYPAIMTHALRIKLAVLSWIMGFALSLVPTISTACLEFCGPNMIDHFLCDVAPLQILACSDPFISIICTSTSAIFSGVLPLIIIIGFYIHIIMTVSKIKTEEGKQKAFSTCTSHLIVASLYYGTGIIVYVNPNGSHYDKYFSFMFAAFTPMINPFIYTFRNKDVKKAFRNSLNHLIKEGSL